MHNKHSCANITASIYECFWKHCVLKVNVVRKSFFSIIHCHFFFWVKPELFAIANHFFLPSNWNKILCFSTSSLLCRHVNFKTSSRMKCKDLEFFTPVRFANKALDYIEKSWEIALYNKKATRKVKIEYFKSLALIHQGKENYKRDFNSSCFGFLFWTIFFIFYQACSEGNLDTVASLLLAKANVNMRGQFGSTPLITVSRLSIDKLCAMPLKKIAQGKASP